MRNSTVTNFRDRVRENSSDKILSGKIGEYKKPEDDSMDDLLQKYIEKVDRDQSDLRKDIKDSEDRVNRVVENSEQRMDKRLDRIEQMINDQNNRIDALSEKITTKLEEDRKYRHTNNIAIVLGVIATVAAMVGIYYATVSTIASIVH
ncbi:MAG: DUF1515 family protein [Ruminococcus sp.]|jgi:chemotaxis regulatin CheY-phosphate phosphatase CheZ|uniref:DUF1515 family protein n=1 Tax=Clostridia TaxID=186801 RepID=UPI000E4728AF|nr:MULTISPECIES: DUF1515 family protein [Clostridia]RHS97768.1 DUF1515 domain-containing protein [Ruminococcus sp. AM42-11]